MASITEIGSSSQPFHHSSSAESSAPWMKYDVFLSFRGPDTRRTIVSSIYHELDNRGIKTFMDDSQDTGIEPGSPIHTSLMAAIKESLIAIVVLSPDYASSQWCLRELSMIVQYMEERDMIVIPIFYGVEPSDVRHLKESFDVNNFAKALTRHKERFDAKTVDQWRDALTKIASLSGFESKKYRDDQQLGTKIADIVCSKVRPIEWNMYTGDFVASEAKIQVLNEITGALQHNEVTIIGLHGMGGVGKTSIVEYIAAQVQRVGLFSRVIMVVISQTPNFKNIQDTLADLLGLELRQVSDFGRAARIRKEILRGYKILIILDDIWARIELFDIGIPHQRELQKRGSKIIFTTRILHVCHSMNSDRNIPIEPLSQEDAWDMFVKTSGKSFHNLTEFYEVARTVANECAGLPVALVAVARALGDKDLDDWREAARRLKGSQPAHFQDEKLAFKCIKLSYDHLASDDDNIAKVFFLLCCLFPEGSDIEVEDLLVYALGKGVKGLFEDADTIKEARARAYTVIKYLKASSLLLESACYGCVKMHDVIRDVAISISLSEEGSRFLVKAGCGLKEWSSSTIGDEGYLAISLMRNEIQNLPNKLVCPKLKILLLQCNALTDIPDTFFQSSNDLRILDVSESNISTLPSSLALLTRLQALYLDDCKREVDISILGKLKSLQILSMRKLDIKGSRQKALPKEIGQLTNLKMLDITDACFQTVPSNVVAKLKNLEELRIRCGFCDWGSGRTNLLAILLFKAANFDELAGLPRLNNLEVHISDVKCLPLVVESNPNWVNFNICISTKGYMEQSYYGRFFERKLTVKMDTHRHLSRYLTLNTTVKKLPDWFVDVVAEKTEILEYTGFKELLEIGEEYHRGRLHRVKYLSVIDCHASISLMRSPDKPVFERLEELYLEGVSGMRTLCHGTLAPGSLSNLKLLNVRNCLDLSRVLLKSSLCNSLQNLEILHCENTEMRGSAGIELHCVFELWEEEQINFPNLRGITICNFPGLRNLYHGHPGSGGFQNLKSLVIRDCNKLEYIFDDKVARLLSQLELLWVEKCSGLRKITVVCNLKDQDEVVFPKLKVLYLNGLPKLRSIINRIGAIIHTIIRTIQCPSLEHLYVCMCPKIENIDAHFNCSSRVKYNDEEHFAVIFERLFHRQFNPEEVPQFFSKKTSDFSNYGSGENTERIPVLQIVPPPKKRIRIYESGEDTERIEDLPLRVHKIFRPPIHPQFFSKKRSDFSNYGSGEDTERIRRGVLVNMGLNSNYEGIFTKKKKKVD